MRNPPWTRDEHILALDFYQRHRPQIPGKESTQVIELSDLLNRIYVALHGDAPERFRNPAGVYMKLMNFRRFDPGYQGVGLAHGNKDEEVVWNLFSSKPGELNQLANHIASFAATTGMSNPPLPDLSEDEDEGEEGQILSRTHRYRERDKSLVQKKKAQFIGNHQRLSCEVCGFDFEKAYGSRGADFIECHHTKPVSSLEAGEKTKLSELALVCSNCHRMIHRKKPWLSLSELQLLIAKGQKRNG
jgi:5-methylcytosine-specific restriction enzyme A